MEDVQRLQNIGNHLCKRLTELTDVPVSEERLYEEFTPFALAVAMVETGATSEDIEGMGSTLTELQRTVVTRSRALGERFVNIALLQSEVGDANKAMRKLILVEKKSDMGQKTMRDALHLVEEVLWMHKLTHGPKDISAALEEVITSCRNLLQRTEKPTKPSAN